MGTNSNLPSGVSVLPGMTFSVFGDEGDVMEPHNITNINQYNSRANGTVTWLAIAFALVSVALAIAAIATAAYFSRKQEWATARHHTPAKVLPSVKEAPPAFRASAGVTPHPSRGENVCKTAVVYGRG